MADPSELKASDVEALLQKAVSPIVKQGEVEQIADVLTKLSSSILSIEIPSVKDITGGGPLDTKDGRVRLVDGDITIKDGKVFAEDVNQKSGYSLGKDGISRIKEDLMKHMTDLMKRLEDKVNKKIGRTHH